MTRLTRADIRAAHGRYYKGGEKMAAVAASYGVDRTTLHYAFVRERLPLRPHRTARFTLSRAELNAVRERLDRRETLINIADDYAMSDRTLRKRLNEAGYSAAKGTPPQEATAAPG